MILEIQHETRLAYTEAAAESVTEVRLEPTTDGGQSCRSFHLSVSPTTGVFRYQDGFGNRVHHFNLLAPHMELTVRAASLVETFSRPRGVEMSRAVWPLNLESGGLELFDFLHLRGPVRPSPLLEPIVRILQPTEGEGLAKVIGRVSHYIYENFSYARHVTLASSAIDDVLTHGKGVCQDFTHLMLAIVRSFGIPGRYVSGYIHRDGEESQSHAWCEVWLPDLGWIGVDPTNDRATGEHHVKVAIGRDFTDVPPNKGIYRGRAQESIFVRVETRELESLPSMSWQDQLPPLQTPMMAVRTGRLALDLSNEDESGQQQQQQQQ